MKQPIITSAQQPQVCPQHGPYTATGMRLNERFIGGQCPVCAAERKATQQQHARQITDDRRRQRIEQRLGRCGIPRRFLNRRFDNYRLVSDGAKEALQIAKTYADRFETVLHEGTSLILCGRSGTGKTHLATAIANQIIQAGRQPLYSTVSAALRSIKETWTPDAKVSERQAIDLLIQVDLLILDEVGVQFGTNTEKLLLFEVLNGRYEAVKPSILISNLTYDEITEYLGERLMDRLTEGRGAVIPFGWESYRPQVQFDPELSFPAVRPVDWSD